MTDQNDAVELSDSFGRSRDRTWQEKNKEEGWRVGNPYLAYENISSETIEYVKKRQRDREKMFKDFETRILERQKTASTKSSFWCRLRQRIVKFILPKNLIIVDKDKFSPQSLTTAAWKKLWDTYRLDAEKIWATRSKGTIASPVEYTLRIIEEDQK